MATSWAPDLSAEPTIHPYPATWRGFDAVNPYPESVEPPVRERRELEDDPRAEFIGAYLDREI
jgi:hypothetical protein